MPDCPSKASHRPGARVLVHCGRILAGDRLTPIFMDEFPFSYEDKPNQFVQQRLLRFQADLQKLSIEDTVQKHILLGPCYIFDHDGLFDLQSAIAKHFGISPTTVHVVGSAQLGFSVVDSKRYKPFNIKSDIDVAIVSDKLFDEVWDRVLRYDAEGNAWNGQKSKFCKYLMSGWIRPDALPPQETFSLEWWKFFQELGGATKDGKFKVAAGIYRTPAFLEVYHQRAVKSCKTALELSL